jgi:hypothetical protein
MDLGKDLIEPLYSLEWQRRGLNGNKRLSALRVTIDISTKVVKSLPLSYFGQMQAGAQTATKCAESTAMAFIATMRDYNDARASDTVLFIAENRKCNIGSHLQRR